MIGKSQTTSPWRVLQAVIAEGHQYFWVYTPIGSMFVMAHRLAPDDEMYDRGFKRIDYDGLCEFEYWLDSPAIPIIKPEMQNVRP